MADEAMRWRIDRAQLDELLEGMLEAGIRLVAPQRRDARVVFEPVSSVEQIDLESWNSDLSPKELFFPRSEVVFRFAGHSGDVRLSEPDTEHEPTVVFAMRPCDAAGLDRLRMVFSADVEDRLFLDRLDRTTVITLACTEPQPWCFCAAVGCGPDSSLGSDLLLTEVAPEVFIAEAVTAKGEALVGRFEMFFRQPEVGEEQRPPPEMSRSRSLMRAGANTREIFSHPGWHRAALACLGCGACAYCCPTCHCFDFVDEGDGSSGRRLKVWDCCAFANFTVHASGHNPRGDQIARYRQRVLHKFVYFADRFGTPMCVGCGRCVRLCPAGQDIYESATGMLDQAAEEGAP